MDKYTPTTTQVVLSGVFSTHTTVVPAVSDRYYTYMFQGASNLALNTDTAKIVRGGYYASVVEGAEAEEIRAALKLLYV